MKCWTPSLARHTVRKTQPTIQSKAKENGEMKEQQLIHELNMHLDEME